MNETTYTIQQVAQQTGLSKQVIRKWETRYNVIQPARLANGYRTYTAAEIAILRRTKHLTEQGHTVAAAAEIAKRMMLEPAEAFTPLSTHDFIQALQDVGMQANDKRLLQLLEKAHHTLGLLTMIDTILLPFLTKIGILWCDNSWSEYQEAVSSQTIRDFLANARRHIFVADHAPLIIGSCLPEERHEIPMQILLIRCSLAGYRTLMLGPSPAPLAIEQATTKMAPQAVLLSGSTPTTTAILQPLDDFAATTSTTFFLGGKTLEHLPMHVQHIHLTNDLPAILQQLAQKNNPRH